MHIISCIQAQLKQQGKKKFTRYNILQQLLSRHSKTASKKWSTGQSVTLFTGAKNRWIYFAVNPFYSTLQYFSPRTFHNMSRAQFAKTKLQFWTKKTSPKAKIIIIKSPSTQQIFKLSEADLASCRTGEGWNLRTIISTNIDDLLPNAFLKTGMSEKHDFLVFIPQADLIEDTLQPQPKNFHALEKCSNLGDLKLGEYNLIRQDLYLNTHEKLRPS